MRQPYNEYACPSSLEAAKLHEEANSIGAYSLAFGANGRRGEEDICKCCENSREKAPYSWCQTKISSTLQNDHGVKISLLFDLIKLYSVFIFAVFCVSGLYAIYQYNRFCDSIPEEFCYKFFGVFPKISDEYLVENLLQPNEIVIWDWLNFISYLLILFCSILVGILVTKRDSQQE